MARIPLNSDLRMINQLPYSRCTFLPDSRCGVDETMEASWSHLANWPEAQVTINSACTDAMTRAATINQPITLCKRHARMVGSVDVAASSRQIYTRHNPSVSIQAPSQTKLSIFYICTDNHLSIWVINSRKVC